MTTTDITMNDTGNQQGDPASHSREKHKSGGSNNIKGIYSHAKRRTWKRLDEDTQTFLMDALILLDHPSVRGYMDARISMTITELRSAMKHNGVLAAKSDMDADAKRFQRLMRSLVQVATAAKSLTSKMQEIMDDLKHVEHLKYVRNMRAKVYLDHVPENSIIDAFSSKDLANLPTYLTEQDREAAAMSQILDRYKNMDKLIGIMPSVATYCLSRVRWYRNERTLAQEIFSDFGIVADGFRAHFLSYFKECAQL